MDRNLGATLVESNTHEQRNRATGTLYQWGRKDPMTYGTITSQRYPFSNPEESYAEPTAFAWQDMYWTYKWDRYYWSSDQKTMYDPCPPGWTVADRATWDNISVSELGQYSVAFNYDNKGNRAVYPISFHIDSGFGYYNSDWDTYQWTSDFMQYSDLPSNLYISKNGQNINDGGRYATDAFAVRCKKDVGFTVTTGDFQVMAEYAIFTGNVKYNDATPVTERGFVWSSTTSEPTLSNATSVASGAGDGDYTATITGLKPQTTYYVRAYATGGNVTKYSRMVEIITKKSGSGDDFTEDDYEWE
jgi:hypothetical protein